MKYSITIFWLFSLMLQGCKEEIMPNSGLKAYYTFEKECKNTVADNYHGINNNIAFDSISPSNKGYSALFNPVLASRISIALNPFYKDTACSVCFWMKSYKTAPQAIIHGNSLGDKSGFNIVLDNIIKYNQYFEFLLSWGAWDFGGKFENYNTGKILDGKWHFVAITIKPKEHRLYIDGILIQTNSSADGLLGVNINNGMIIGQFVNNTDLYLYEGHLDNLRLYNRAISKAEVELLHTNIE